MDWDRGGHAGNVLSRCLNDVGGTAVSRLGHAGVFALAPEKLSQLLWQRNRHIGLATTSRLLPWWLIHPFTGAVMALRPRLALELLTAPLGKRLPNLGRNGDGFTPGQQPGDSPVKILGWRK